MSLPPVKICPDCDGRIMLFPTLKGRVQVVNAEPDEELGNIQWLHQQEVSRQLKEAAAAELRASKVRLWSHHATRCEATRRRSIPAPRSAVQRPGEAISALSDAASPEQRQAAIQAFRDTMAGKARRFPRPRRRW